MNYKVLYRKYRPTDFVAICGQNSVVKILKNSIENKKIAHAYIFSGPRGTGKTSTARIFAKAINCLDSADGEACGKCESCLSFASNPDIIEIDAASNNGVDEIRELINNVKIMPTSLKYKVYIIDEVHMLSQSAFNALLLTLEEPPEHVVFILATTNIENVPITILSRCQKFDFQKISNDDIFNNLKNICKKEDIKYTDDGLREIANYADGGLRDALSILDQLAKNDDTITENVVVQQFGGISDKKINDFLKNFDSGNVDEVDKFFEDLRQYNLNYKTITKKLIINLANLANKILNKPEDYQLSYDECKNIVFALNDILNKININVDAYLLIKMIFIDYLVNKKQVKEKKLPKNEEKCDREEPSLIKETNLEDPGVNSQLTSIRINNCFVEASKNYLLDLKPVWQKFISDNNDAHIRGLINDTEVVMASPKYIILVTPIAHQDDEINNNIKLIEDLFFHQTNTKYSMICIDVKKWDNEKKKYISNLKNNYVYKYINEDQNDMSNEDNLSSLSDVFDINKIEVE